MDQSSNNKIYSATDIQRYHSGKMTASEMHALEKAALTDPFLADALEGYPHAHTPLQDLKKIEDRLHDIQESKSTIPLFFRHTPWMRVAAILLVIAGSVWLLYQNFLSPGNPMASSSKLPSQTYADTVSNSFSLIPENKLADTLSDMTMLSGNTAEQQSTRNEDAGSSKNKMGRKNMSGNKSFRYHEMSGNENDSFHVAHSATPENVNDMSSLLKVSPVAANKNSAVQDRVKKDQPQNKVDSMANKVSLHGNTSGIIKKDTISNVDVVLKPINDKVDEVVVVAPGTKFKQGARPIVIVDTLEPAEGWVKFDDYVANNIRVDEASRLGKMQGEVQLTFFVNQQGNATDIKVEKSLCKECDQEVIRLLKEGPKWKKNKNKKGKLTVKF